MILVLIVSYFSFMLENGIYVKMNLSIVVDFGGVFILSLCYFGFYIWMLFWFILF